MVWKFNRKTLTVFALLCFLTVSGMSASGVCQASCRINTSLHILDITDLPLTLSLCQHGSGL